MRILLLAQWRPSIGGVVTHVDNLMRHSVNDFTIISYPPITIPLLRALGFLVSGLLRGIKMEFDVIHAHYAVPQGLLGVLLKKIKKKPLMVTLHGSDVTVLGKKAVTRPLVAFVLGNADRVIAVSGFLKREAVGLGASKDKTRVIYGGTSLKKRSQDVGGRRGKRVLFMGALVRQKGVDLLVRAFKSVAERHEDAELVIVGEGVEKKSIERLCDEVEVNVKFMGSVDATDQVLRESDVLVLPSREEGLGLVLLEAMAVGVPVVATRVGGVPEIVVSGENGLLVEKEDPEALAEAIIRVLEDRELSARLVFKGYETVKNFSWEKMANEVDELYRELSEKSS